MGGMEEEGILGWEVGVCSEKGIKSKNEDRAVHSLHPTIPALEKGNGAGLFGLFDGHAGDQVSEYLSAYSLDALASHPLLLTNPSQAILEVCQSLDDTILDLCEEKKWLSGSTATFIVIHNSTLTLGNLGDGLCLLSRGEDSLVVFL